MRFNRCDNVEILISAYLDGEATESEWTEAKRHIQTCKSCATTLRQFQQSTRLYGEKMPRRLPQRDLWQDIMAELEEPATVSLRERLHGYLQKFWQEFVIAPAAPVRFAQAAVIAFLAAFLLLKNHDTTKISEPLTRQMSLDRSAMDSDIERQQFLQASNEAQVKQYLEKAGLLLLEIKNSNAVLEPEGRTDLRLASQDLLKETILVRKTLEKAESQTLARTVELLEMLLFDLANLDNEPEDEELEHLRAMIVQGDLLIKIEIYEAGDFLAAPQARKSTESGI